MARRRVQDEPVVERAATFTRDPAEAAMLVGPPEDLECDRSDWLPARPCKITGGAHDEWCAVLAARRAFYGRSA